MADFAVHNDIDDELGDFDAGGSTNSDNDKVDSLLIKRILFEMKSEFNRGMCTEESVPVPVDPAKLENNELNLQLTKILEEEEDHKLRIKDDALKAMKEKYNEDDEDEQEEDIMEDALKYIKIRYNKEPENIEDAIEGMKKMYSIKTEAPEDEQKSNEKSPDEESEEEEVSSQIADIVNPSETNAEVQESLPITLEDNKSQTELNKEEESIESPEVMPTDLIKEPPEHPKDEVKVISKRKYEKESDSTNSIDSSLGEKQDDNTLPKKKARVSKDNKKDKDSSDSALLEENILSTERKSRRSLRNAEKAEPEISLKRSSRRMSKEYSRESVLQNAIARKEKSMSSLNSTEEKYRRSSRLSEDKNSSVKSKTVTRSSVKGSSEDLLSNVSSKTLNGKGKYSIVNNSEDDNESFDSGTPSSTPKKVVKNSPLQQENGTEDEWSNVPSSLTSENEQEKGIETSSTFSSSSSVKAKKHRFSFSNESFQPPAKKSRLDISPTVPEASEAPPGEPALPILGAGGVCECLINDRLYPSKGSIAITGGSYCRGLDCFENRIIGCCNVIDENTPLLRPSRKIPLLSLCELHIGRLVRHNCCPTCGLFCTQGIFNQCKENHFFHKNCGMKKDDHLLCPHCGTNDFIEVKLSLGSHQYPIFLPSPKQPNKSPLARMSISRGSFKDLDEKDSEELNELIPQKDLVFNKKKFTTEGLPPVEKEKLDNLLHAFDSKNDLSQRFSARAFYQACKNGDAERVLGMLGSYVKESSSLMALHAAAGNGHLAVVHILVQVGAALETLDKSQYTPLMLAALHGHNSVVKYLVKAGADVSFKGSDGMTALHLAAKIGNLEACHYLLSAANTPVSYVDSTDDGRWTPLVWAAENNHADIVRYLLEKKADPQIRDSEMNIALHWSAYSGSMEITEDLLNYGSHINLSNVHGDTPLHIAARQGADNCVMLLLARGAKTDVVNKAGQYPKDCVLPDFTYCRAIIELNMKIKNIVTKPHAYPRILSNDISRGHEDNPIQCINNVDDDPVPTDFTYITENCVTSNLSIDRRITSLTGCKCEDTCTNSSCMCTRISFRCWYDNRGKLLPEFNFEDPPMIFECNQTCGCNALTCKNRVVQKGLKVKLQVCKTRHKNWGVITLREIPKGTYVCEYIGEIISDCEADTREDDSYLFDLDNRDGESYCIDACRYGNVTRFVNHSCNPNLVPVRIFVGHHDLHFPRIAFFAARDIAPNEELSFDYGEKFWVIKYKNFTCSCEELNCRYSSTKIHDTLEKYKERLQLEEPV